MAASPWRADIPDYTIVLWVSTIVSRVASYPRLTLPDDVPEAVQHSPERWLPYEQPTRALASFQVCGWVCRVTYFRVGSFIRRTCLEVPPFGTPSANFSAQQAVHHSMGPRLPVGLWLHFRPRVCVDVQLFLPHSSFFGSAPNNCIGGSGAMACLPAVTTSLVCRGGSASALEGTFEILPLVLRRSDLFKPHHASASCMSHYRTFAWLATWLVHQLRSIALFGFLRVLLDLVLLYGHVLSSGTTPWGYRAPHLHLCYLGNIAKPCRPPVYSGRYDRKQHPRACLSAQDNVSGDAPNCPPPAASLHWWTSPGHPLCKLATLAFLLDGYACFPELLRPIPVQSVYQNAPLRSSPDKWVRCDVVHPRTETRLQAPGPPPSPHAQATDSLQAAIHPRQPPVVWRFQVMCPMHRAECIEIALDLPVAVDSALARVAQKLTALDLDFASTIVPVQPQPVSGYATLVLTGDWLEAEGNTVVIYDLRAMGGPMFAQHLCIAASYGDISSIAARFHLANWQAFAFGSQTPVSPGTRFRSVHGGLIKIVQQGTIPSWGCSFEGMLSGRTEWCSECPLYWEGPSQSVLVADFDRTIALRRIPFNCATLRASVSKLLGIAQTRLVLDHPQKGTLENVLHFGEPCSGVVAAREAPTVRDSTNRGFCVFLDPRQVGRQICKLHIMQPEVSADDLARFAGILRSPQGFFTSFCADRATSGRLVVQDGDVITFGFCPIEPASASSIDGPSDSCPPVIDTPQRHDDTPATAEFRLLREPYSTSLADRERIEQIRDEAEADGRVWPYLPADDPFAQEQVAIANDVQFGSGEVCRLVFVILTPGMANETVAVLLTLPATLEDALDAVADARNGHNRQFFPHLGVVQPQPFLDFGTLHALPEWCPDENVVCFNLADWDGRFYTTIMPPRATREDIIHHAGITVPDAVNVLVGTSVDPLADAAWADLTIGCCVSFYPRHMLPGPYFFLHDMLLAAATWATAPAIPAVPASDFDNRICAVCETGCRLVRRLGLDSSPELAIASALDMSDGDLLKQESAPAVYDAALHGWPCHRVFAVAEPADPITGIRTRHVLLSLVLPRLTPRLAARCHCVWCC